MGEIVALNRAASTSFSFQVERGALDLERMLFSGGFREAPSPPRSSRLGSPRRARPWRLEKRGALDLERMLFSGGFREATSS